MLEPQQLQQWANKWQGKRVLVVGDLMLDEYIVGVAERISPEAPVPVILCERRTYGAGGAANTALNLISLGAKVVVCGVVGDDWAGEKLRQILSESGADITGILIDPNRPTTLKTRIVAQTQQVARVDVESRASLNGSMETSLRGVSRELGRECHAVIVSDYAKGVTSQGLLSGLRELKGQTLLTAGPKPKNIHHFAGFDYLSLNRSEAMASVNGAVSFFEAGKQLSLQLEVQGLVITLGGDGCALFSGGEQLAQLPALRVQVYDVAGAGDTFLAALTLGLVAGCDFVDAAKVATVAAAAVVRKVGVATTTVDEMLHLLKGAI
ncbi:MAG: bifunctional ADP-heptose synthase [Armatimonadetes bacterium]|nr:bifunctional ADP-heptose synthase [Armatimonadota bacterium]MCX7969462.1 bifunctional ADP-heptose synthase [Armatimonadota bacterium]MDW8142827.1 bifunctional ADP-heptose synthase [Armatimonadota bacterium]